MNGNRNSTLVAEIVNSIKQKIIFGRLRPRERLVEEDIAPQFGASRHLVRAAMVELEQLGLVTRRQNKGASVKDFTVEEVEQIYEMRALLQTEAAQRIPMPAGDALIARLEAIHQAYCEAHDRGELQQVCTLNNQFHRAIWAACGNSCLSELIERLWTATLGIRCYGIGDPDLLRLSRSEHARMIEMLRLGDRAGFVNLQLAHMRPSLEAYKRAHGGWAGVPIADESKNKIVA